LLNSEYLLEKSAHMKLYKCNSVDM